MLAQRKRRIYFIVFLLVGMSITCGLALFALRQNINLYYTPSEVSQHHLMSNRMFRLGGRVVEKSIQHSTQQLEITFLLADQKQKIKVFYRGLLPSLFKEGQDVVADGYLHSNGVFIATQVLAKHDAQYKPIATR